LSNISAFPLRGKREKKQNGGRLGRGDCGVPAGLQLLGRGSAVHAGLAQLRKQTPVKKQKRILAD